MTRVRNKEQRCIDGRYFDIYFIDTMEYDGSWRQSGYELWDGKLLYTFFGYPTDTDIRNFLQTNENQNPTA